MSPPRCSLLAVTPRPLSLPQWLSSVGVDAVLGHAATLPCDIEPASREDRVYMVLWFRRGAGKPLYRFDVRGRALPKALYWSDADAFGPRAYFSTGSRPAGLTLDAVQPDDEGVYRCRVDFRNSPTRNYQVNLTVIVPPREMLVYAVPGEPITSQVVGPLTEGTELTLTCEVRGGKPQPTVSWFVGDKLAGAAAAAPGGGEVTLRRLEVGRVRRQQLNTTFKCQASNSKLVLPAERTLRLELYLKPVAVRMADKPRLLTAGRQTELSCQALGSRPPAVLTWWRDGDQLPPDEARTVANETAVESRLVFSPRPEHDGQVLRCRAENPSLPGSGLEDSLALCVVYPPQVSLQLGNTLNPDEIKEGDDVYFECDIRANPREHKIVWLHDGAAVTQNVSSGVILSTRSLVLQGVARQHGGLYTCAAANTHGETASRPVALRVRFAPVCRGEGEAVVGASPGETVRLRCDVAADPEDARFEWQFSNSGEGSGAFHTREPAAGAGAELQHALTSDRDYGTLACWGRNSVGRQAEPCVFHVVPAVNPSPLRNCTLRAASGNHSADDHLEVDCVAGYDGGLPQSFVLEAYDPVTMSLRLNLSASGQPSFLLQPADLLPADSPTLRLLLYAANQKGRSEAFVLEDVALGDAERRTGPLSGAGEDFPLAALLAGAALAAAASALLAAALAEAAPLDAAPGKQREPPGAATTVSVSHGDQRYVMSYMVKPAPEDDCKPDILNPSTGSDGLASERVARAGSPKPGSPDSRRDAAETDSWQSPAPAPQRPAEDGPADCLPQRPGAPNGGLHFNASVIPGPESCV
ncbi:hemicentin-2-like [Bacillus rossius redtenbacheri]|uniref:hemicentin-2-like n=1 Tax=Bacillus rossius redtenbacheri TaxID=93214 RepID=UPI002FDD87F7